MIQKNYFNRKIVLDIIGVDFMANGKRETPEERAARDREERIALLKMKQGLIEESEIVPESGYEQAVERGFKSKISGIIYRNKIYVVLGTIFTLILVMLVVQLLTREKEDLYVLVVAYDRNSQMEYHINDIEETLEKYCPDFDGNGKVHVSVSFIDRTTRDSYSQYDDTSRQKLYSEFENGDAQLIIADEEIIEFVNIAKNRTDAEAIQHAFLEYTDKLPEDELFYGCGVRANKTVFAKNANWSGCPDNVIFLVRDEIDTKSSNDKKNAENRERAQIVLQNILDNNIVNPPISD